MTSISFSAPSLPEIFAKNAPANESPHPVGSTTLLIGYAGKEISPKGNLPITPPLPLFTIIHLGPGPACSH